MTQAQDPRLIHNYGQGVSKWSHIFSPVRSDYRTSSPQIYKGKVPVFMDSVVVVRGSGYPSGATHKDTTMIKPTHRYFNVGDSSYNKIVANEFQHPFNFRMIRKPESNILGFLSYFIPYTAAAIIFTGLLFYLFFGFPAGLRGWLRKEFQGLFGVGRNHPSDSLQFRVDSFRNTPTANLLGQVRMALEGSWLQKLQENIERDYGEYPGTYTQCCVLPSEGPLGMVDCQIFRQGGMRKRRTRCSSNLIYNFEFGQGQNHRKNTKKSKKRGSFAQ